MVTISKGPEMVESGENWLHFSMAFGWDTVPSALLLGARWLGEFAYIGTSGVYPGSRVVWRLPESLFERGGFVELAFKATGTRDLTVREWDEIGWTWTGVFNATTRSGTPHLETAG